MTELDDAVATLQEVMQQDLEQCGAAIREGDSVAARRALESATAKLGGLTDLLRSASASSGGDDWG